MPNNSKDFPYYYYFNNNLTYQERYNGLNCNDLNITRIDTTIRRNNLANQILKSSNYLRVLILLTSQNQSFYNVVEFCKENNENVYEIEIIREKKIETKFKYYGYHIFAASDVDLEEVINSQIWTSEQANSRVKWIHNYQHIREDNLTNFMSYLKDLKEKDLKDLKEEDLKDLKEKDLKDLNSNNNENNDWILIKNDYPPNEKAKYSEISDLTFIYDLRKYCGNIDDFINFDYSDIEIVNNLDELQQKIPEFHQNYVVNKNNQPNREIVWKFLQQLNYAWIDKNRSSLDLNWKNVEKWKNSNNT